MTSSLLKSFLQMGHGWRTCDATWRLSRCGMYFLQMSQWPPAGGEDGRVVATGQDTAERVERRAMVADQTVVWHREEAERWAYYLRHYPTCKCLASLDKSFRYFLINHQFLINQLKVIFN